MKGAELEQLYRTHGSFVLRRARKILRNEDLAMDAMQDVFVRVIKSKGALSGPLSQLDEW